MWKCLLLGGALACSALAQTPGGVELANLREDVRGLSQRVGDLSLRVEQLERENGDLRQRASTANASFATLNQVNSSLADLERSLRQAIATSKNETLEHVGSQMAKLARDTNAAANTIDLAISDGAFQVYYDGQQVFWKVQTTNTGAVVINVNGGGPKALRYRQAAVSAGMLADTHVHGALFDAAADCFHLITPPSI